MHILVANDDGIHAPGIRALAHHLSGFATVTVVAPDRPQSATSHAITLHKPLHADEVDYGQNIRAFQVNGTPADCIKLGIGAVCAEEPPDIVVSGINSGANVGLDIVYSGTASAAAEAALQGVPAIALSLTDPPFEFAASIRVAELLIRCVTRIGMAPNTYLNVNIPPGAYEDLGGIAVTKTGIRKYQNNYEQRVDPLGRSYYWQAGEVVEVENLPDTDVHAVQHGFVSVTPVHLDFTNASLLATLKQWNLRL